MAIRLGLIREVVVMAIDTVRGSKMRSALTVLGVVIGITSIVGMTALIRGFDHSLREMIGALGPDTIFVQRFSFQSFSNPAEARNIFKRPNLTISDARAIEQGAPSVAMVDIEMGRGGIQTMQRVFYRDLKTKAIAVIGSGEHFADGTHVPIRAGRFFNGTELQFRKNVVVIGDTVYQRLFAEAGTDPIGKTVRVGPERFTIVGVFDKTPSAGGFNLGADDFVTIPYTVYQRVFGLRAVTIARNASITAFMITVIPREGAGQAAALVDVERVLRSRHGLKLDQANDFDLVTQDSFLKLWDSISQGTFFALVVISSIALMVGGIGVMAVMSISVTERTREIGVRKALGARRVEILFQFLVEAAVLTSAGGLIGVALGAGVGYAVHFVSGFPVSLPWWSFVIGLGFSATVGLFFGMYPAFKASRLDPIEALRYE